MSCTGDPWRKRRRWRSATIVDAVMSLEARCTWCLSTPAYIRYHDEEWGKPQHDDRVLFEFLILEGAQAGLRSEEHTSELQSLMRISYAVFCLKKKTKQRISPYHVTQAQKNTNYKKTELITNNIS